MHYGLLCHEGYAQSFALKVGAIETKSELRDLVAQNLEKNASCLYSNRGADAFSAAQIEADYSYDQEVPEKSVFVMSLNGPVMPESDFGIPGLDLLSAQLRWAMNEPNIAAIVFKIETGGGSTYKLWQFCDLVREVRQKKPVLFHISGMSCSAGVAIHVCGTEILADHPSAEVGSIGACLSYLDFYSFLEKQGCKYTYVNAPTNPDKNKVFVELREGKTEAAEASLLETHKTFRDRVRAERSGILDTTMTGIVYTSTVAAELGIIDGIASLEQVIDRAYELSQTKNPK